MKHGYYLPRTDKLYGDLDYAQGLKELYHSYGINEPGMWDGASRFDDSITGKIRTVVLLLNLFPRDEKEFGKPVVFEVKEVSNG